MVPPLENNAKDNGLWEEFLRDVVAVYTFDGIIKHQANDTIEFLVGEHPSLPQQGWKFLRFSSKNRMSKASAALRGSVLERGVELWHELADNYGHYEWDEVKKSLATYDENCGFEASVAKETKADNDEVVLEGGSTSGMGSARSEDAAPKAVKLT